MYRVPQQVKRACCREKSLSVAPNLIICGYCLCGSLLKPPRRTLPRPFLDKNMRHFVAEGTHVQSGVVKRGADRRACVVRMRSFGVVATVCVARTDQVDGQLRIRGE